jgi:hypothetical protein
MSWERNHNELDENPQKGIDKTKWYAKPDVIASEAWQSCLPWHWFCPWG